jgi:hypothetical protein
MFKLLESLRSTQLLWWLGVGIGAIVIVLLIARRLYG